MSSCPPLFSHGLALLAIPPHTLSLSGIVCLALMGFHLHIRLARRWRKLDRGDATRLGGFPPALNAGGDPSPDSINPSHRARADEEDALCSCRACHLARRCHLSGDGGRAHYSKLLLQVGRMSRRSRPGEARVIGGRGGGWKIRSPDRAFSLTSQWHESDADRACSIVALPACKGSQSASYRGRGGQRPSCHPQRGCHH